MKKYFKIVLLSSTLLLSCSKDDSTNTNDINPTENNPINTDIVTSENVTYEANGSFTYTDASSSTPKNRTHQYVKIQYKDVSHLWKDTYYTYLSFYNTNSTAAAEMITFVFLGKEIPKTGTYKIGPNVISVSGITEADKLLSDEVSVLVVANGQVTKRDTSMTIKVVNNNGNLTITSDNEIKVYDNLMGTLKGTCKDINFTRTTKKL